MLNQSKLKKGLLELSKDFPGSPQESGKRMAAAYRDYAQDAMGLPGSQAISLALGNTLLSNQLGLAFATGVDLNITADQMATAFTAFWPNVSFAPVPPAVGPGVCVATGTSALSIGLKLMLPCPDADISAQRLAALLDTFTKMVMVTYPLAAGVSTSPLI